MIHATGLLYLFIFTFYYLIMVKPLRPVTSNCPGCKVLKLTHNFGSLGKHCHGNDLVEDAHGSQAELQPVPITAKVLYL